MRFRATSDNHPRNFHGACDQMGPTLVIAKLTDIGNTQCKQLGEAMRSYFVDDLEFLPPKHNPGDVFVRYDSDSRTKQSAMAFCDGLYPPGAGGGTTTTVIDMYTMDDSQEDLYLFP
ncbi:hypothetical protein Pelo_6653 [Pelomyxa schiedti]|nr:hypothetical protein Pelo_6653 [Pelomyxa schiedti]